VTFKNNARSCNEAYLERGIKYRAQEIEIGLAGELSRAMTPTDWVAERCLKLYFPSNAGETIKGTENLGLKPVLWKNPWVRAVKVRASGKCWLIQLA